MEIMKATEERALTPLGKLIKKRVVDMGIKQYELAERVGTSAKYLDLIMYGARKKSKYIPKIINELGIDVERDLA